MRSIICFLLLTTAATAAETNYHAISLRGGGHVVLRHGVTARTDFVKGDARYTSVAVKDGTLVIVNCPTRCPRDYEMTLAVAAPDIRILSVRDGGAIEALGDFPEQDGLRVAVGEGGAIDGRAIAARAVTASVDQGGAIYVMPRAELTASVSHGGQIVYWGNPKVTRSILDGGVIRLGSAQDAHKPLEDIRPKLPPLPALPDIPPLAPPLSH